jgi:mono/diheme cytochrome c family protein
MKNKFIHKAFLISLVSGLSFTSVNAKELTTVEQEARDAFRRGAVAINNNCTTCHRAADSALDKEVDVAFVKAHMKEKASTDISDQDAADIAGYLR